MKNLTLLLFIISVFLFSCDENPSTENIVYDTITVHLGDVIFEDYGGWILISDNNGTLLGEQIVSNNTIAEVEYEVPSNGNKHLTLLMLKEYTNNQETDAYKCQTFTNISNSPIFMKFEPNLDTSYSAVEIILNIGSLEDATISTGTGFNSKYNTNLNTYGFVRVPDYDPNVFVAVLKENEDFWRYGIIPTNGNTLLEVSEEDLEFQTPNAHLSTSFEPDNYRIELRGIRENGNDFSRWGLNFATENSFYTDVLNGTVTFNSIEEHSLISNPEGFTKFETQFHVWDTIENVGYGKRQVGEQTLSFHPDPIAFQVVQNNKEINVINESDYSQFDAVWYNRIDLPNGKTFQGEWHVNGEFEEAFQLSELPSFTKNIFPEEIQPGNLSLIYVAGVKDSRFSNYTEFLQKYLYSNQEFQFLFKLPEFDYNEDAYIETTSQRFD